jgi:hypothetical protein
MISVRAENMDEVASALRRYRERAEAGIGRAVQATGIEARSDVQKRILRGPKTGRVYLRGTVAHRASGPGEAPATDTGTLASSVRYQKVTTLTAEIESRLDYATILEFGSVHIAPRPAWQPAADAAAISLQRRIADAIRELV